MVFLKKCGLYAVNGGSVLWGELAKCSLAAAIGGGVAWGVCFVGACIGLNALGYLLCLPVLCYLNYKVWKKLDIGTEIDRDVEEVRDWTREKLMEIEEQENFVLTKDEIRLIKARRGNMEGRNEEIGADISVQRGDRTGDGVGVRLDRTDVGNSMCIIA